MTRYADQRATLTRGILQVLSRATDSDIRAGLDWYPRACSGVESWSRTLGIPRATVACCIAALSPQCRWNANLKAALALLTGADIPRDGGVLNTNITKARRVLAGNLDTLDGVFKAGPKVKAFSLNLQGYADAVTVDVHAAQAATGIVENHNVAIRLTPPVYEVFADCYRAAASLAGMRPCDTQAVVWTVWKHEHPPEHKRLLIRHWDAVGPLKTLW